MHDKLKRRYFLKNSFAFLVLSTIAPFELLSQLSEEDLDIISMPINASEENDFNDELYIQAGKFQLLKDPEKYNDKLIRSSIAQSYLAEYSSLNNPSRRTRREYHRLIKDTLNLDKKLQLDVNRFNKGLGELLQLEKPSFSSPAQREDFERYNRNLGLGTMIVGGALTLFPLTSPLGLAITFSGAIAATVPELSPFRISYTSQEENTRSNNILLRSSLTMEREGRMDESIDRYRNGIGIPSKDQVEEVVNQFPEDLRNFIQSELDDIRNVQQQNFEALSLKLQNYFDKKIDAAIKKSFAEIRLRETNERIRFERQRRERMILDQEIQSGIYLTGVLLKTIGLGKEAHFITNLASNFYKAYKLTSSLASIGTLAATAGYVGIALSIYSLFSSSGSNGIGKALQQISKQINALRKELNEFRNEAHLRFDALETNQRLILESINKLALQTQLSSNQIKSQLNEIITRSNFGRIIEYDINHNNKVNELLQFENQLYTQFGYNQSQNNEYNRAIVDVNLTNLYDYAINVSDDNIFTSASYQDYDQIVADNALRTMHLESSMNLTKLIQAKYELPIANETPRNPIEFSRGTLSFITNRLLFSELDNAAFNTYFNTLLKEGTKLRNLMIAPLLEDFVKTVSNAFYRELSSFLRLELSKRIKQVIQNELQLNHLFTSLPTINTEINTETNLLHQCKDRIPDNTYLRKERTDKYFGSFFTLKESENHNHPMKLAQKMGIISVEGAGNYWRTYDYASWKEYYKLNKITFHHGRMKNKVFEKGWHESRVEYQAINRPGWVCPSRSTTYNVSYLAKTGYFSNSGTTIDDTHKFFTFLKEEIQTVYQQKKSEFNNRLISLYNSDELYKAIPSIMALRYIASLGYWYQTGDLVGGTKILRDDNYFLSKSIIDQKIREVIKSQESKPAYIYGVEIPDNRPPHYSYTIVEAIADETEALLLKDIKPFIDNLLAFSKIVEKNIQEREHGFVFIEETLRRILGAALIQGVKLEP